MKNVKITESELVNLIEKLVKENLGFASSAFGNGNGQNMGIMGTPTAKYKEIFEKEDIEDLEEEDGEEEQLNLDITDQPGSDDEDAWMEGIQESRLINRLKRRLIKEEGKGCAKSDGGDGCIDKDEKGWFIWNNKKGGIFKRCSSEKDCEEILSVPAVHG
tara:strand:- start:271 stop:750 length:480 start_codon:yes stop_codon:yes gene_type:complete